MLGEISYEQLSEWMAYAELEPFGAAAERTLAEWRTGLICATVANTSIRFRSPRFTVEDFLPQPVRPHGSSLNEKIRAAFKLLGAEEMPRG